MDNLAGKRNRLGRISPDVREAVVVAHGAEQVILTRVLGIDEVSEMAAAQSLNQPLVYLCSRRNPLIVTSRKTVRVVEPAPHDEGAGCDKHGRVCHVCDEVLKL